jgi:hypothetical protein
MDLATERFSAGAVASWRAEAARLQHRGPLDVSNGWHVSDGRPSDVVAAFDRLRVREGLELRAYRMQWARDGESRVYAVPEGTELPTPDGMDEPPPPPGALPDPIDAVDGDGSPEAFLQASILARELDDFEAFGHGARWVHCTVVDDPRRSATSRSRSRARTSVSPAGAPRRPSSSTTRSVRTGSSRTATPTRRARATAPGARRSRSPAARPAGSSRGLSKNPATPGCGRGHFAGSPPEPSEIRRHSLWIRAAPGSIHDRAGGIRSPGLLGQTPSAGRSSG